MYVAISALIIHSSLHWPLLLLCDNLVVRSCYNVQHVSGEEVTYCGTLEVAVCYTPTSPKTTC